MTCGGRLRQETLSPTVDRRVRRTSRVVEEAESISCLCNYVLVFLLAFVDGWMDGWMGGLFRSLIPASAIASVYK